MLDIVQSTKDLPESLAETGECRSHAWMHLWYACSYIESNSRFQGELTLRGGSPSLRMQCLAFCMTLLSFYMAEHAASTKL